MGGHRRLLRIDAAQGPGFRAVGMAVLNGGLIPDVPDKSSTEALPECREHLAGDQLEGGEVLLVAHLEHDPLDADFSQPRSVSRI